MGNAATPSLPTFVDANFQASSRISWTFAPHEQNPPNMSILLEPGSVFNGVTLTEVAAQSSSMISAPVGNPRIDRVVVNTTTGAISVVTGVPAVSPTPPAIPSGNAPIAQVTLQTSSTAITNLMITDERNLNSLGLSSGAFTTVGTAATKAASDAAQSTLASVLGSVTTNHLAVFADTAGTIKDGGPVPAGLALPGFSALKVTNNSSTPNTKIDVTAEATVMVNSAGAPVFASSLALTIDLTGSGANGMDTGSRPPSGWVYIFAISNGSTTAGLASISSSAPTLPSGYAYKARAGAMYCDGSQNLKRTLQYGRRAQYVVTPSTNTASMPLMASGTAGSTSIPTWVSLSVAAYVPATASVIRLMRQGTASANGHIIAPNNNYAGEFSFSNPPPIQYVSGQAAFDLPEMILESSNIYYAAQPNTQTYCFGWEDNL